MKEKPLCPPPIDPKVIPSIAQPLLSWALQVISPSSLSASPIAQAGVDTVGQALGWLPPPTVISNSSAKSLLQSSPVALASGAIALKTLLFTEAGAALAMAPVVSSSLIGLAFLVGVAIGTGIDYGVGAILNDGKIDTASEWLATKWAEALSFPVDIPIRNDKGQWTTGWRYIPYDAPSGAPTDPVRSPGQQGSPITAPSVPSTEEMEMKRKKEETIGDRPESHETLEVSSPKTLLEQLTEDILKNPDDQTTWQILADYLSEHGDPQRGELILLEDKIAQTGDPQKRAVLEKRKAELEMSLTGALLKKWQIGDSEIQFTWKRGYLESISADHPSWTSLDYRKLLDVLIQSEDSRFLGKLWIVPQSPQGRNDCILFSSALIESSHPQFLHKVYLEASICLSCAYITT